ncbi:MAG: PKD domain-containing protein [Candidatus Thermoplasmatota archaeon]
MELGARRTIAFASLSLLLLPLTAHADDDPATKAFGWLASQQQSDGTFGAPASPGGTVAAKYVVEALAANGIDPKTWPSPANDAYSQMGRESANDFVRPLHASSIAGYERHDLVTATRASYHDGTFGTLSSPAMDSFAIMALRASGAATTDDALQATAAHLLSGRSAQGGWGASYAPTQAADTDTTASVLAALASVGIDMRGDARALLFLNATHATGGGHAVGITLGNGANTQSTVWALNAYRLLDAPAPSDDEEWLLAQQRPDGSFAHDAAGGPSAWATAEVAAYLGGARFPLPGIVPPMLSSPHALELGHLTLPAEYSRAHWEFPDGLTSDGTSVAHTFPSAGTTTLRLDASGARAIHRGPTSLAVLSARPVVVAPPEINALRNVPVELDVSGSYDPDGTITAWSVTWGDGNTTSMTTHAYTLPGDDTVTLKARDDAGEWSQPAASVIVHVANRAPVLSGLPARIATDRLTPTRLAPDATDADGDTVSIDGPREVHFDTLGEHAVRFVASDPFGANDSMTVLVEVANIPPTLSNLTVPKEPLENATLRLTVDAADRDGPIPEIVWAVANSTVHGRWLNASLRAGEHVVNVTATDAEGASVSMTATLRIRLRDAPAATSAPTPPPEESPRAPTQVPAPGSLPLASPRVTLPPTILARSPANLSVEAPEDATLTFDYGDGSIGRDATHAWPRPGDYELRVTAHAPDGRSSIDSTLVHVDTPPTTATPLAASASVTAAPTPRTTQPAEDVRTLHGSARETPAPWGLALSALLLAAAGTHRRRGAR